MSEIAIEVAKVVAIEINRNAIDKDAPMSQDEFKLFCTELVARSVAAVDAERGKDAAAWRTETGYEQPKHLYHSLKPQRNKGEPLFLSPTIPEGMALVPIEPTQEMSEAALNTFIRTSAHEINIDVDVIYKAMIQAGVTK